MQRSNQTHELLTSGILMGCGIPCCFAASTCKDRATFPQILNVKLKESQMYFVISVPLSLSINQKEAMLKGRV